MAAMRAEKVERLSRMDWESPTVAWMKGKTGSRVPSDAGTGMPAWFMAQRSPTVLMATDLPPALGPLMTRVLSPSRLMFTSRGTALRGSVSPQASRRRPDSPASSRGWRPP